MFEKAVVLSISKGEEELIHRILCATPHIYYATDGNTYILSPHDAAAVRSLRYLTSLQSPALVLSPGQSSLLRGAVARLYEDGRSIDEIDWFYAKSFASADAQLKALMTRLVNEGFEKRAIYVLRPHH